MSMTKPNFIRKFHRFKSITKILILTIIFTETLLYYYFFHHRTYQTLTNTSITQDNKKSLTYSHLIDLFDTEDFVKQPLSYKCQTYFKELYQSDPDWQIGNFEDLHYIVPLAKDKNAYERELFKIKRRGIRGLTKEQRLALKHDISLEIEQLVLNNLEIETQIFNSIGHLKVYGSCNENTDLSNFANLDLKLFPWLTKILPEYKRWDGTVVNDRIPVIDSYIYETVQDSNSTYQDGSFIEYLHENMNGKGVVLSISDVQVNNTIRLIKVLRHLQNEIPIQLVHKGDLSQESQNKLITLARNDFEAIGDVIKGNRQELWFVDTSNCIASNYHFEMYLNKWLSMIFNTFDDVMFLDDDAIPFLKPSSFFQFPKYQKHGLLFYKDREIESKMEDNFHDLYLALLPSEQDEKFFNIKSVSKSILRERFFTQFSRHQMESGLLIIKRSSHFTGLLISTHLQIWTPTSTPVHGDKELFWLGQLMAGSSIVFNNIPLGASGWLNDYQFRNKLCSIQPTHVHDEDSHTLLWVNSGLSQCKYDTWDSDIKLPYYHKNYTVETLHEWLKSPLLINTVIIPPDALRHYSNSEGYPIKGWQKRNDMGCLQYYFCAFDKVGGDNEKDWNSFGKLIRYNEEEQERMGNIAKVWSGF